jgi:hypothetical protein
MQASQNQPRNPQVQNPSSQRLAERIRMQWNRLSDEEIASAETEREQFCDAVSRKYGQSPDEVEKQLRQLERETKAVA